MAERLFEAAHDAGLEGASDLLDQLRSEMAAETTGSAATGGGGGGGGAGDSGGGGGGGLFSWLFGRK